MKYTSARATAGAYTWIAHRDRPHAERLMDTQRVTGNDWKKVYSVCDEQFNGNTFSNPAGFTHTYRYTYCVVMAAEELGTR